MSYTIVDDEGVIQVRASINTTAEMRVFIERLVEMNTDMLLKQENPNDRDHPEPVRPVQAE